MKKLVVVFTVMAMILLAGCGQSQKALDDQKQVVTDYLSAVKAGDFAKAKPLLKEVPESFDYNDNPVMKTFFERLTFEVKSVKASKTGAVVSVAITLPNTTVIYDNMMTDIGDNVKKLQKTSADGKSQAATMMIDYLMKAVKSDSAKMVVNTVEIEVDNTSGKPLIVPNENLAKALSGIEVK